MRRPTPSSAPSQNQRALVQRMLHQHANRPLTLADLQFDEYAAYWLKVIHFLHDRLGSGHGEGERIAIIDSGFSPEIAECFHVDRAAFLDLTGEGHGDTYGHGSLIAILVGLAAPHVTQIHVKILDGKGKLAGDTFEENVANIQAAFDHLRRVGVTMVNVSWNYLNIFAKDFRARNFCSCPLCRIVTTFILETDADVFVSEGNYRGESRFPPSPISSSAPHRNIGDYSCPAAATLAVPVVGVHKGSPIFDTNLFTVNAIQAPAMIQFLERKPRRFKFLPQSSFPFPIQGTSFSTPLVAGTFACLRSALRVLNFPSLSIPRGIDTKENVTSFNFSLEVLFDSPKSPSRERRELHEDWRIFALNTQNRAQKSYEANQPDTAGELCCFAANLMAIPYQYMEKWDSNVLLWPFIWDLYALGIAYLHQSKLAITARDELPRARQFLKLANHRGENTSSSEVTLAELEQVQEANQMKFLFRI